MTAVEVIISIGIGINITRLMLTVLIRLDLIRAQKDIEAINSKTEIIKLRVSTLYLYYLSLAKERLINNEQYEEARKIERLMKQIEEE